ncbi:MAG: hypothetical protein ACYCTH_07895 [Cellulomonas sp.]
MPGGTAAVERVFRKEYGRLIASLVRRFGDVDLTKLEALWSTDETETKARAGQMIIEGAKLPIAPGRAATSGADH